MLRDPKSFTDNMKLAVQVLYESGHEMTPAEIARNIHPPLGPLHLTAPLRALRVGGWVKRRKEQIGTTDVGYRSFPVIRRNYRLTDEGRAAWSKHVGERRTVRLASANPECDHNWIEHYSAENGDKPDARVCLDCGKNEQLIRPTRFPDLHDQLTSQTRDTLSAIRRAPWRERAVESLKRGLANLITFKVRK